MSDRWLRILRWFTRGVMAAVAVTGVLAAARVVDNSSSPAALVRTVGLDEVRWTSGFWAQRLEVIRTRTLPAMAELMTGTNRTQFFLNFEIAAGLAEGRHRGAPFNDGEFYKFIEAASAAYAVTGEWPVDGDLDRMIDIIAAAQRADGYLHTPVLIAWRNGDTNALPFSDRNNFEVYNLGHLMAAACVHHRATGKTSLLAVAIRAARFLEEAFANPSSELARNTVCPSHYMGLIELHRETRERRYLELAHKLFAMRDLVAKSGQGGDDNQDRVPFFDQTEAVGHAVRANYLCAGAADLFIENGEAKTWAVLDGLWTDLIQHKLYVTGGCGALYDGASPYGGRNQKQIARVHQAYGRKYELPNTTAHNETCANIGNAMWNWRMFLASGEARFMDMAELALYNSILSGVSLDGTNYFYTNPLRVTNPMPVDLRWSRTRTPYVSSFCCPPNLARLLAELGGYAYGVSSNAIWVNLYGASRLTTNLGHGGRVAITQETEYPWNGHVRIVVDQCAAKQVALKLRIPGWAKRASVRVNHGPARVAGPTGTYFEIYRRWETGDVVDLDIPMPVQLIEANPLVEETLGQLAVKRGPVVYCIESVDLPPGVRVMELSVPTDARFLARYDRRLLGGVVALDTALLAIPSGDWNGKLYRERETTDPKPVETRLIPYYAWGNRGKSEMSVWFRGYSGPHQLPQ